MPQPISVGAVLGGRYRITEHVVTSADQDMVFLGADQVLNRRVTVLVASRENATQVASSARELATGERTDDVQVLDLGISEGRTYLIAGGSPNPDALLGLAYAQELYVEPFQTDTLGSEIFGESRTPDPHAYDDDEAYYTDLDRRLRADEDQNQRRPGFLNRISERLSERVRPSDGTAAKAAAGASALAAADAATRAQQEERERAERAEQERAERARREAEERARAEREAAERAEEERRTEAERARRQAEQEAEEQAAREREAEQARLAAAREQAERRELERRAEARRRAEQQQAEQQEAERREAEQQQEAAATTGTAALPVVAAADDGPTDRPQQPVEEPTAPVTEAIAVRRQRPVPRRALMAEQAAAAAAAVPAAAAAATPAGDDGGAGDGGGATPAGPEATPAGEPERGTGRRGWPLALLLLAGLLAALLGGGMLLAQNLRSAPTEQAAPPATPSPSAADTSTPAPTEAAPSSDPAPSSSAASTETSPTPTEAAAPQRARALRVVPDLPAHESEHDAALPLLVDGDPATAWRSFAYARPNFGGYVGSMNLVVELEDRAEVNEVTLQNTGATGGAWYAYIADSAEGENAKEIGTGSFDEDTVTVPVPFEGAEAEAEYVIISLTALPRLEGTTPDLPFGLRLGEIGVR